MTQIKSFVFKFDDSNKIPIYLVSKFDDSNKIPIYLVIKFDDSNKFKFL